MDFGTLIALGDKLRPLMPEIEQALPEIKTVMADPQVKAGMAAVQRYANDPKFKAAVATLLKVAATLSS